ncbi:MAG: hypothetical protein U0572_00430 [Phycisphaerales bacterium]
MKTIDHIVRAFLLLLIVVGSSPQARAASLCCPSDLDGDAVVGAADLAFVLGAWGPAAAGAPADLNGSGQVDASDLAIVLGSWGICPTPCLKTLVVGNVQFPDGTPAPKAVVVTQLGGMGVSGADGSFSFEVDVEPQTTSLNVTAVVTVQGVTYSGTKAVAPIELGGVTSAGAIVVSPEASCSGEFGWLPGFELPGVSGAVHALTVFDDGGGGGPALYAGGDFAYAGGATANYIAKWDGSAWSSLGTGAANGVNGPVYALTVVDVGGGGAPSLYVGGEFTSAGGLTANRIAKWNGNSWGSLGTGSANGVNSSVRALTAFDDGSGGGPALYAGGIFTSAGGATANRVAKWNGSAWSSLGTGAANGVTSQVYALTVFDAGSGPALYAGGDFLAAGGVTVNGIAKWNGNAWSSLGTGVGGIFYQVRALTVFDDGGGPALYAGGTFTTAGAVTANRIAKWNGNSWSSLGTGAANGVSSDVYALTTIDAGDGTAPALYAGGIFTTAGGVTANRIARWNGSSWSALGTGSAIGVSSDVNALAAFDGGVVGPVVYAGGIFTTAGGVTANRIARWNGSAWSAPGADSAKGLNGMVRALTVFDDGAGGGPALYAGGFFTTAGGVTANRIAKWNGSSWSSLGAGAANGVNNEIYALTVFDDGSGSGPALYAGGFFTTAGGVAANRIAKWNGSSWSSLGTGSANGVNFTVRALTVFDNGGGGGPALYVGGAFTTAGGVTANRIAKWNGSSWSPLGAGAANGVNNVVYALTSFDDGSGNGPRLYVGGEFTTAGGATANRIARWNGSSWSPLGTSAANGVNGFVYALTVFDNGSGPALYVGGAFTATSGSVAANRVAKWNGSSWSSLGTGAANGVNNEVYALTVFDDGGGGGPALCVGGAFTTAGGVTANRIAKWNGSSWSPLGTGAANGMSNEVYALTVFDDGSGGAPALCAGGFFTTAGGVPANDFAAWGCVNSDSDAPSGPQPTRAARREH